MANIGTFEVAAQSVDPEHELDTFTFCGQEFTVAPEPNMIALGRFAKAARQGAQTEDMESLAILLDTIASCVVKEDETRFLDTAANNRANPDTLLSILGAVMEAQSGNPTPGQSESSDGLSTITQSLKVPSSSEARSESEDTATIHLFQSPLMSDPRVTELVPVKDAGKSLAMSV